QPVVDEEAPPDDGAGMNLDAGQPARDMRHEAPQPVRLVAPQPVRDAMPPQRVQPRIVEDGLQRAACRRIALENGLNVFPHALEHGLPPQCCLSAPIIRRPGKLLMHSAAPARIQRTQRAAQHVEFGAVRRSALHQAPQAAHEQLGLGGIKETAGRQHVRQCPYSPSMSAAVTISCAAVACTAPAASATATALRSSWHTTCTAAARLSEAYCGLVAMRRCSVQRSSSALLRPLRSRPNTSATCWRWRAPAAACAAAERTSCSGQDKCRLRALVPITSWQSATASSSVLQTCAACSISVAPEARASACVDGKCAGVTSARCASPMTFMARAVAPMLPGCCGATSTMRNRSRASM